MLVVHQPVMAFLLTPVLERDQAYRSISKQNRATEDLAVNRPGELGKNLVHSCSECLVHLSLHLQNEGVLEFIL